jgi:hypothetical protein
MEVKVKLAEMFHAQNSNHNLRKRPLNGRFYQAFISLFILEPIYYMTSLNMPSHGKGSFRFRFFSACPVCCHINPEGAQNSCPSSSQCRGKEPYQGKIGNWTSHNLPSYLGGYFH